MNNKGFTLIELIATLMIIAIVSITIVSIAGNTFSINKEKAYELMKDNITSASYDYINECDNKILTCSYKWENNKTSFYAIVLKESGYIKNLNSPIDDDDLSYCLIINATKLNGTVNITIEDNCN